MPRFMTIVLVFFGVSGFFAHCLLASYRDARMDEAYARKDNLSHTWQNLKTFEEDLNTTYHEIEGGLSLAEAIYRIESSSREHFPSYLLNLHFLEHYPTIKEQVAHNILRHFQVAIELDQDMPQSVGTLQRLEKELQQMFPGEPGTKKTTF